MFKKLIVLAAVLALSGCATLTNLDKNYSLGSNATKSIVIVGVKPEYRFGVEEGNLVINQFKWDAMATPILAVYPENGYVVAVMNATDADQIYALTNLAVSIHHYRACGDKPVDTFTVEPGKIIYLGDYEFPSPPDGLAHSITYDPDSAEKFIRQNYPKLNGVPFTTEHVVPRDELGYRQTDLQAMVHTCD